jgi:hypothetical protein
MATDPKLGTLEDYLKGIPLNEDLAALKRGEDPYESTVEAVQAAASTFASAITSLTITDDDREHLRRLILEPGWRVMIGLLDNEITHQEDTAKAASMNDPLGNRDQVANYWAYVAMLRQARTLVMQLVENEVAKLKL